MIEIRGLQHRYGKALALDVPRLSIDASTVLVGHNGAGKSTLLLSLAGLLVPTDGVITIGGDAAGSPGARRRVSFVPDSPALFDDLTLADQMRYVARLHGGRKATPAEAANELVELLDATELLDRLPSAMSKGQRQKASLLVATARPCSVLLADEPTTGLDTESRVALLRGFAHLEQAAGVIIVSSTHDGELIAATPGRLRLSGGRPAAEPDPAAVGPVAPSPAAWSDEDGGSDDGGSDDEGADSGGGHPQPAGAAAPPPSRWRSRSRFSQE
ncbi:MAG: ATP-binding cassette domain-containing protein [Acidimicrobiia bacterium]|nr:ATP-binding cassette domain-containing protein [Acidimicrobiia bacterium]